MTVIRGRYRAWIVVISLVLGACGDSAVPTTIPSTTTTTATITTTSNTSTSSTTAPATTTTT
ncbi:MAG: hypothetical protein WD652_01560, partial [Acidimicrobiia bacterium]